MQLNYFRSYLYMGEINVKAKLVRFLLLAFFFSASSAYAAGKISIKNAAFVEKVKTQKNGKKVKSIEPAVQVVPGEEVIFVITYRNDGEKPSTDVVITNPIPKHMTYKSASGDGKEVTQVSVDGGKKFGQLKNLKVKTKKKERQASLGDVTHVKWTLADALPPKKGGKVRLRAILN